MSTVISDRIAVLPKVSATSQTAGFVERPTVADLVPEGTEAALRSRLGFGAAPEYVTTPAGREAFWADLGRPQPRIVAAHDAEAFWADLGRPQASAVESTFPSGVERVSSPEDREAFAADLGRPGGYETARPTTERVTDPAAVEAFWRDISR